MCSEDKTFVVSYFIGDPWGDDAHLEVYGNRFPGIKPDQSRPVRLCLPKFVTTQWSNSTGAFVNALIRWCLKDSHHLKIYESKATK